MTTFKHTRAGCVGVQNSDYEGGYKHAQLLVLDYG